MKEQDFIKIIKEKTKSTYLGDDCAYLEELGIVVTQDNFIEDIHFKREWATPYQIGYKAAAVNISDILASGAEPAYISVGLSLPNVNDKFIDELYSGIIKGAYGAEIIGGDITGSNKICISITAIGKTKGRKISSRKNAKPGFVVITNGEFGMSSKGLSELQLGIKDSICIKAHLEPQIDLEFSKEIASQITENYAMMDTSDGLADALFQIAKASNVKIVAENIEGIFGAEDYNLVAAVPRSFLNKLTKYKIVANVQEFDGTFLQLEDKKYTTYEELNLFNHFEL